MVDEIQNSGKETSATTAKSQIYQIFDRLYSEFPAGKWAMM